MIHVIFFDQWFTSITTVMKDLKDKYGKALKIVACSENPNHAYRGVVDEFIVANWKDSSNKPESEQYTDWLLNRLKEHKVDIAFLRKHTDFIIENEEKFKDIPIDIVLDINNIKLYKNKTDIYNKLNTTPLSRIVPEYYKDTDTILSMLDRYTMYNKKYIIKLDSEEGGQSFRKIESTLKLPTGIDMLLKPVNNTISVSSAIEIVKSTRNKKNIIFMPYLYGPELSVDCVSINKGFVALCRKKVSEDRSEVVYRNTQISNLCEEIQRTLNIKGPFNVQFRYTKKDASFDDMRLTDINFRMSGGVYLETAIGCNICELYIANRLNLVTDELLEKFLYFKEKTVTHYETGIEIK